LERSVPLLLIVRDYLGYADTARGARKIISSGEVMVDGVVRSDPKFPCGLMDVISIPKIKENYRVLIDSRGILRIMPISLEEAKWKLCRIEKKTVIKGGKTQLNLHDGRNIIVEDKYKTGYVLKISIPDQEILDVLPFEKGNVAMITGGRHTGEIGEIESMEITRSSKPNVVNLSGFSTTKPHVFPVGKDKPLIKLPEVKRYG
jgi:small subunit ribosomal protein S4e